MCWNNVPISLRRRARHVAAATVANRRVAVRVRHPDRLGARVLNTCPCLGFRADSADREEGKGLKFFVCNTRQGCESHPLRH